jgi:ketosteroid isomerase-like protein
MSASQLSSLVRRLYADFLSRDRKSVDALLSEDFTFSSPQDDHISKAKYFERCWPNGDRFRSFDIKELLVQGDEAFVLYEVETKDGARFRNTEFLKFEADQVKEIDVYFGRTLAEGGSKQ